MTKLKPKFNDSTTIEEVENFIEQVLKADVKEIDFSICIKIAEALGATYEKKNKKKGSMERFRHTILYQAPQSYTSNGYFGVHIKSKGNKTVVNKRDFKDYFLKGIKLIIELKRAKNEK